MNLELASAAVLTIDRFAKDPTPQAAGELLHPLRPTLLWAESRLRTVSERKRRRAKRLAARFGPHQAKFRGEQIKLLRAREAALAMRRQLLRQIGDAIAWIALDMEPNLVIPLAAVRTHQLNRGVELGAQAQIVHLLGSSGRFFPVEADLTRCIGIGDIVAVPVDRSKAPIPLELKAEGELVLGAQITVEVIAPVTGAPMANGEFAAVREILGLQDPPVASASSNREDRQARELVSSAELSVALSRRVFMKIGPPPRRHWKIVANVLRRTLVEGACWDSAEAGIAYIGIRRMNMDDPSSASAEMLGRVRDAGFGEHHTFLSTDEFQDDDRYAALIPPIAMWDLARDLRRGLLSRELFLGCVFSTQLWHRALAGVGVDLEPFEAGWKLKGTGGQELLLSQPDVHRLTLGIAFAGISPSQLAAQVAEMLR